MIGVENSAKSYEIITVCHMKACIAVGKQFCIIVVLTVYYSTA